MKRNQKRRNSEEVNIEEVNKYLDCVLFAFSEDVVKFDLICLKSAAFFDFSPITSRYESFSVTFLLSMFTDREY